MGSTFVSVYGRYMYSFETLWGDLFATSPVCTEKLRSLENAFSTQRSSFEGVISYLFFYNNIRGVGV